MVYLQPALAVPAGQSIELQFFGTFAFSSFLKPGAHPAKYIIDYCLLIWCQEQLLANQVPKKRTIILHQHDHFNTTIPGIPHFQETVRPEDKATPMTALHQVDHIYSKLAQHQQLSYNVAWQHRAKQSGHPFVAATRRLGHTAVFPWSPFWKRFTLNRICRL